LLGENGHAFGWNGKLLAEHHFAKPRAAQDATGARGTGLLGECGCETEDAATALRAESFDAVPL
jgi:hypothetical protein